jgi:hypothetical protein
MSRGEPGLPGAFVWRGERYAISSVVRSWRSTTTDRGDVYVDRHWYEVETEGGRRIVLYFDRRKKSSARRAARWWIYTASG